MRALLLLIIFPAITFAQSKKTVFLESGSSVYVPFTKQTAEGTNGGTYGSNLNYTYKTTPGFYLKAGLEIGQKPSKRFHVTLPLSIGYKEFKTNTVMTGSYSGCFSSFNGTETTKTTNSYGSVMIGPKFNFNFHEKVTFYTALNMNIDLFLSSKSTIARNDESLRQVQEDFKVVSLKVDDLSLNSSLQIGVDYRLTDHFQVGLSVDTYFSRLNNLMNKYGPYLFNYNYGKRSAIINGGVKLGYTF